MNATFVHKDLGNMDKPSVGKHQEMVASSKLPPVGGRGDDVTQPPQITVTNEKDTIGKVENNGFEPEDGEFRVFQWVKGTQWRLDSCWLACLF